MQNIVFLSPFFKEQISGGIKVSYQHATVLMALGYDVTVFSPDGQPTWFETHQALKVSDRFELTPQTVYVFPEVLQGDLKQYAETPWPGRKVLFCQNQYHLFSHPIDAQWLRRNGFENFIAPSRVAASALETILGLPTVQVVSVAIDHTLFFPRVKTRSIAFCPRKWPGSRGVTALADLIQRMFLLKYPQFADIPWICLDNMSQRDVAEALGQAAIYLSLAHQEAIGLMNLEAMASGCAVVGLHGIGGKEYATSENGLWFSPEQIEEMVDSIASVLLKIEHHSPDVDNMILAAQDTASRFNTDRMRVAISHVYDGIMNFNNFS